MTTISSVTATTGWSRWGRGELRIEAMRTDKDNTAANIGSFSFTGGSALGISKSWRHDEFYRPVSGRVGFRHARNGLKDIGNNSFAYIAAYLECLRWVLDPLRHQACADILVEDLGTEPDIASETVEMLRRPGFGLEPAAAIDEVGMRNTIALRASQLPGSRLRDPREYIDLSYHAAAVALATQSKYLPRI